MNVLWPRLDPGAATALFADLATLDVPALSSRASTTNDAQTFASTGGRRATEFELLAVRSATLNVASRFGFPNAIRNPIGFDRELAPALIAAMPMTVGEATTRSVWNFSSLVLMPDLTFWRFGVSNRERWVCSDRTRHMFSRLWWQAHLLAPETEDGRDTRVLDRLGESDLNQLLERTSIGGNPRLVRTLARSIVELEENIRTRDLVRNASLRVLRLVAVVDAYALSDDQLGELVKEALRGAGA